MRIAILGSRGFPSTYGGYETLVRHLVAAWAAEGHDVSVYCRSRDNGRIAWVTDGVRCYWTPGYDSKNLSTLSYGATSHIHAVLRGYDAALVLNVANGFYLPMLRACGVPSALNTDGIEWDRGKWGHTARRVFLAGARLSAKFADVLIADSQAIRAVWQATFGVDSRFIPYGATVSHNVPTDRITALGLVPSQYLLVVARLIPENNVELFLEARDRMAHAPVSVIVGSGVADSAIERRLRALDERGAVRWLGHIADQDLLLQLWAHCGVYVHGHSVGGTNPALLQALGAGAPTLALDTPFNREVVRDDRQLFPPAPDALAMRVAAVLGDDALRQTFGARGQAIVARDYDWTQVCSQYLDALVEARTRRGARPS